jgi:hypothetical protein
MTEIEKGYVERYLKMAEELKVLEPAKEVQILASGFNGVRIAKIYPRKHKFPKTQMDKIAQTWKKAEKEHKGVLWNGPLASVMNFKIDEYKILEFILRKSDFRLYLGTRSKQPIRTALKPLDKERSLPLSFGAVTITSDNFIVLGIREKTEAYKGEADLRASGYFDPEQDIIKTDIGAEYSVELLILRESYEELGTEIYIAKRYLALIQDAQPLLSVEIKIPFSKEQIGKIAKGSDEHSESVFVENNFEAIKTAFQEYKFTPHTLSAIICHLL